MDSLSPKKSFFGIDLSDLSVKIAQVIKRGSVSVLTSLGKEDIPAGFFEKGEVLKEKELINIIRKAVNNVRGSDIKTKYAVCSLPEDSAFIKVVRLPKVEDDIEEVIKWQIEPNFPVKLEEVYFDWEPVRQISKGKDKLASDIQVEEAVSIAVVPKNIVDSYLSIFHKAGIQPIVFEIESMAVARSLIKNINSPKPVIILDMGKCGTGLTIFSGSTILFSSHINISGQDLDRAIARELKVKIEEAEKLKKEIGLINIKKKWRVFHVPVVEKNNERREISESKLNLLKAMREDKIFDALIPILTDFSEQVDHFIDYFKDFGNVEYVSDSKISKIILCGGESNLIGLCDFLSSSLNLKVELGDPLINISKYAFPQKDKDYFGGQILSFVTAIGLAERRIQSKPL
ncbi:MAG: type IV pilus assembly protein PilM [Patescibacteria group bacterium]